MTQEVNGHPAAPGKRFALRIEGKADAESAEAAVGLLVGHVRQGGAITVVVDDTATGATTGYNVTAVEPVPAVEAATLREAAGQLVSFADQVGIGCVDPRHADVLNALLFRVRKALEGRPPIVVVPG